jgi:hypothetical protein
MRGAIAALACVIACSDDASPPPVKPDGAEAPFVTTARQRFPRAIDLHTGVIARSCSPNPGVCHNASRYPDLSTIGQMLAAVGGPCNVELPDPTQGWDACERAPWRARAGSFTSDVAWTEKLVSGKWQLGLRDPAPATASAIASILDDGGAVVLSPITAWQITLTTVAGSRDAELAEGEDDAAMKLWLDSIAGNIVGGDPNQNGTWGSRGDDHGALVSPGSLDLSYLWGRITGTVAGTRMPLANQSLSNDEYVALACWIETLAAFPRALDPIDYDACAFAWYPTAYAD